MALKRPTLFFFYISFYTTSIDPILLLFFFTTFYLALLKVTHNIEMLHYFNTLTTKEKLTISNKNIVYIIDTKYFSSVLLILDTNKKICVVINGNFNHLFR